MALTIEQVDSSFRGLVPEDWARPGLPPNGPAVRALARALNHIAGRHGHVIPGMEIPRASARNTASALELWRTRYKASPNGTTLVSEVHLIPTDTTAGTPAWYLKVDGTAQTTQTHNARCAAGSGTNLDDVFVRVQEVTVTADAAHDVELWTDDNCRVVGWFLHEKERDTLTIGTDSVVDWSGLQVLAGIFNRDVQALINMAASLQQKIRGVHLSYNVDDHATPLTVTSTTPVNIWDSGNTVGVPCPTQYRNTYMDEIAGTLQIPAQAWCYAELNAGPGPYKVRFSATNGDYDISVTGAKGIYTSGSVTLKPLAGHDTVKVKSFVTAGGDTGKLYACGLYPLI